MTRAKAQKRKAEKDLKAGRDRRAGRHGKHADLVFEESNLLTLTFSSSSSQPRRRAQRVRPTPRISRLRVPFEFRIELLRFSFEPIRLPVVY